MPQPENVMGNIFQKVTPEEAQFFERLLPKDYRTLKMMHEVQPDLVFPMAVLGTIQRKFHSPVLKMFDEEYMTRVKSKDRKGILELITWAQNSMKLSEEE